MKLHNTMNYKGYTGIIEFSEEEMMFHGKLLWINDLVTYEGDSVSALLEDFHEAVDDYLIMCEEEGIQPEIPCKGTFNVRVSPELHQKVALRAVNTNRTLNACVTEALEAYVA